MINALELTRRETLLLGAAAFTSSIARKVEAAQDSERHGVSAFGDLKYPPDFEHSTMSIQTPRRAASFPMSVRLGLSIRTYSPSIRSTASSSGAMPPWGWSSPSRA